MKKKVKKRNPNDATMRNVRAANKNVSELAYALNMAMLAINQLLDRVGLLEERVFGMNRLEPVQPKRKKK